MNDSAKPVQRDGIGVSGFLPAAAREKLVAAAKEARSREKDSLARVRTIADAIVVVKTRWPKYFKE